jgi:hypothetical protein
MVDNFDGSDFVGLTSIYDGADRLSADECAVYLALGIQSVVVRKAELVTRLGAASAMKSEAFGRRPKAL